MQIFKKKKIPQNRGKIKFHVNSPTLERQRHANTWSLPGFYPLEHFRLTRFKLSLFPDGYSQVIRLTLQIYNDAMDKNKTAYIFQKQQQVMIRSKTAITRTAMATATKMIIVSLLSAKKKQRRTPINIHVQALIQSLVTI